MKLIEMSYFAKKKKIVVLGICLIVFTLSRKVYS